MWLCLQRAAVGWFILPTRRDVLWTHVTLLAGQLVPPDPASPRLVRGAGRSDQLSATCGALYAPVRCSYAAAS
jgi:hypothetical protein